MNILEVEILASGLYDPLYNPLRTAITVTTTIT